MLSARGLIAVGLLVGVLASTGTAEPGGRPRTFVKNLTHLEIARQAWLQGDSAVSSEVQRAIWNADRYLTAEPFSVVYSPPLAPSGDPHDYVSYGAYWWPNPDTPDGLPWIRRDGHVNPDAQVDGYLLRRLATTTEALSLAYYFTHDEKYAQKSASLIRAWFLDEETRMNPHSKYAHYIPGGRGRGYFDVPGFGNRMPAIFDAAGLLEGSPAWSAEDRMALQQWTRDLVEFGETTIYGWEQRTDPANHGTNYDFLMMMLALYDNDQDKAHLNGLRYLQQRMEGQIAPDGSNPQEMRRANNLLYHRYNLGRVFDLGSLMRYVEELDVFTHETPNGRRLRMSLDYLLPYFLGEQTWDQWPSKPFPTEPDQYYSLLRKAAVYFQDPQLLQDADQIQRITYDYINLTHPRYAMRTSLEGDFFGDQQLTAADLDVLTAQILSGAYDDWFDLDHNGRLDQQDRRVWLSEIGGGVLGDANLDGRFDTADLVQVYREAQYRDALALNSRWATGDWDGDFEFDESDLLAAFTAGSFELGATAGQTHAVPEPATPLTALWIVAFCWLRRRSAR